MSKNKWEGTSEELKSLIADGLMEENDDSFTELTSLDEVGTLSCETEIVGTCQRGGQTGRKIKYTCHYPSGKAYSFHVCDIS